LVAGQDVGGASTGVM